MGHDRRDPLDELRAYARRLHDEADRAVVPLDTLSPALRRLPPKTALATSAPILVALTAVFAVLLVGSGAGVTFTADRSIPGDRLYGIDLLIEDFTDLVGITSDHAVERFAESATLLQQGRTADAIATAWVGARERLDDEWAPHLQTALGRIEAMSATSGPGAAEALDGLLAAAVRVDTDPEAAAAGIAAVFAVLPPGGGSLPPGQDPDFTPPGQDPDSTPPGQDPDSTPPGQDPDFTPPGQGGDPPGQGQGPPDGQGGGNGKGNGG